MIINTQDNKNVLLTNGLKPTFQRIAIYNFLDENRIHPTVDQIFEYMRDHIPTISKTTIYNTLSLFLEKKLIIAITISGAETNYDINTINHYHFYCLECGDVFDIDIEDPFASKKIEFIDGHLIQEVHGYFKGVCKKCNDKNS